MYFLKTAISRNYTVVLPKMKPKEYPPATNLQKGCFKLWQRMMANALNDSGQTLTIAVRLNKLQMDVPWTEFSFEDVFLPAYLGKMYPKANSIKDLNTYQITELYEAMNAGVSHVFGVGLPFPSEDDL